jgi:hypothetical protein
MRPGDPADHLLHIDEQARFDLACNCVAECNAGWEGMRNAINRAKDFWPDVTMHARPEGSGIGLRYAHS